MSSLESRTHTLPLPINNGLSRHKPAGTMTTVRKGKYPDCECCPYGYHIDLDFVRYCETLAQGVTGDAASKQRRKERRRQRKSMEVLLGLNSPPSWSTDTNVPQFLNEPLRETSILEHEVYQDVSVRDELQKAVLDFEDTLQRSRKLAHSDAERAASTFYLPPPEIQDLENGNGCSGLSAAALQNIREQMAESLERMKELEEQVKIIPALQIQLSVLKDEKRKLLEKLKLSENKREQLLENIDLNSLSDNKYYTLPLKSGIELKTTSTESVKMKKPMRDVSVSCVTMTRDVGVNHSESTVTTCDVGINHTPVQDNDTLQVPSKTVNRYVQTSHSEFQESIDQNQDYLHISHTPMFSVSLKNIITKNPLRDNSTLTDLLLNQIYSDTELDANINKAIKLFEKSYLVKTQQNKLNNMSSIGIQAQPQSENLKITEKEDKGVQANEQKHLRNFGTHFRPKTTDVAVHFSPQMHNIGVSTDTINFQCEKCNNNTLADTNDKRNILSLANLSIIRSKSFDYSEKVPHEKPRTRSVACGQGLRMTGTKSCDTSDLLRKSKDIGVNTVKRKLVDAAVGDTVRKVSSFSICDKCSYTIKSVAKDILNQSKRDAEPQTSLVSRIPRPTSLPHQLSPDKPTLSRQDTYTFPVPPKQTSPSRLKDNNLPTYSKRGGSSSEDGSEDGNLEESGLSNEHSLFDPPLFQRMKSEPRKKAEPSKEMRAAMKVLNDTLLKTSSNNPPANMKNAKNIIQQEWFKVSSTANANPLDVEDYLDCLEEASNRLLEYVVNMTDVSGNTAMHYAVSHGNFDVVSILLDSKVCNINQTNAAGYTCIMLVSLAHVRSDTHRHVIKRLFEMADVNIRAKQHGQTALMLAVSHGRLDMVQLLLQSGADMNIQDEDGSTALMCAAEHHHVDIVKLLLAQPDCDLSIRDHDGSTALNIAMEAGNRDIGVLLYAQEHFSRGSSPHTSMRQKRAKSTTPTHQIPTSPQLHTKKDHSF